MLLGLLLLNSLAGLWWADPAAGYVVAYCALREVKETVEVTREVQVLGPWW